MFRRISVAVALIALTALLAVAGCGSPSPVVKKVDHVTLFTQNAQQLFDVFTGTLGLPPAWPMANYPEFSTGGVQAGNVNVETLQAGPPAPAGSAAAPQANIYGIVLEPDTPLSKVTAELETRGAKPGKPTVQTADVNGKKVTMWTNVTLNALARPHYTVYLCQYSATYAALLASHKVSGPLGKIGLTSMRELVISSKDPEAARKQWQTALAPAPMSSSGVMTIGTGPAVRIVKGTGEDIVSLVLEVESLPKARDYLQSKGLLGESSASELRMAPAAVQGLDIRVVAKSG